MNMGLMAKDNGGGFDPVEAGVHHAICYGVVDLGTQFSEKYNNSSRQVLIMWELPNERITIEGQDLPRSISRRFTLSLNQKAKLREVLESWRGKSFTAEELKGFELKNLLGVNCQLNVIHNVKPDKTYANVSSVTPLAKGVAKKQLENAKLFFSMDDSREIPDEVPEWVAEIISKSAEFNKPDHLIADAASVMGGQPVMDDDIPF